MHRSQISRKQTVTAAAIVLLIGVGIVIWSQAHRPPASSYAAQKCSDYGGLYDSLGPVSISSIANDYSKAIVIASVEDPRQLSTSLHSEDAPPRVKVTRVLKGSGIREGDSVPICPGMGKITLPAGQHPTVLIFLEGRDGNIWVPAWGHFGIVPQDENGRFTADWVQEGPRAVTKDELLQLIK